jgi:hypothetical protein
VLQLIVKIIYLDPSHVENVETTNQNVSNATNCKYMGNNFHPIVLSFQPIVSNDKDDESFDLLCISFWRLYGG